MEVPADIQAKADELSSDPKYASKGYWFKPMRFQLEGEAVWGLSVEYDPEAEKLWANQH